MKWSLRLGKFAGVDVYLHFTFLLFLVLIAGAHALAGKDAGAVAAGVGFVLALFGSVLLHEYGHALAARRFGIPTRDITLLPIGGVARLERTPSEPSQELWVAVAGPTVNVVIAAVLFGWLFVANLLEPLSQISLTAGPFLERVMVANLALVVFNLIPAFPMDGGRVLRALLAARMEYARATRIAASIGQGFAVLFGLLGLFTNPYLLLIAVFIWMAAAQESGAVEMRAGLSGTPVGAAVLTDFRVVSPWDTAGRLVDLVLRGSQTDFPVAENGRVVGLVTQAELLRALESRGLDTPISEIMRRDFEVADLGERLEEVFERMQQRAAGAALVLHRGELVGLLTLENVAELFAIRKALGGRLPGYPALPQRA